MVQEFGRYDSTDSMTTSVLGTGGTAPVPVKPGHRIVAARFELATQDVAIGHTRSIARDNRGCLRTNARRDTYLGRPSTRSAMMLRWISEEPPQIVSDRA
jgi:hypothetical protein